MQLTENDRKIIRLWGPRLFLCDFLLPNLLDPHLQVDSSQLVERFKELCQELNYTRDMSTPDKLIAAVRQARDRCLYELGNVSTKVNINLDQSGH